MAKENLDSGDLVKYTMVTWARELKMPIPSKKAEEIVLNFKLFLAHLKEIAHDNH